MKNSKRGFALAAVAVLVCGACANAGDDVVRQDFGSELVHAVCDTVSGCCSDAKLAFDSVDCRHNVLAQFGGTIEAPSVRYDSEAAKRCIDASRQLSSDCQRMEFAFCASVFTGRVPLGGACTNGYECDPGPLGFAVCGPDAKCTYPARGVLGQPCSYSCRVYQGRADCKSVFTGAMGTEQTVCFEGDGATCILPPGGGQPTCQPLNVDCRQRIDRDVACPPETYCDDATGGCTPKLPLGSPCATGKCTDDGVCWGGICQLKAPVSARCDTNDQCQSGRCGSGFCRDYSPAAAAMCAGDES